MGRLTQHAAELRASLKEDLASNLAMAVRTGQDVVIIEDDLLEPNGT